ncbi:MAG: hypothetical protein A3B68_07835 [Candidatus Melainabacteria bacterium RIFCSPHIGHO2_02_FULL_34_12]|nr:MAG: hypothetical protein A3B68_07835 [Candidatus Melainabacteria bacterium RIFCSPHIGHO2_02_FULL_34_12]
MFQRIPILAKLLLFCFMFLSIFTLAYNVYSKPDDAQNPGKIGGEKLFKANCAGCHLNGQNLIKKDKPIIGSAKLKSKELFSELLNHPPKPMPEFKNITSNPDQLDALYKYVLSLKKK